MRLTIRIAQYGNSCRLTLPQSPLRFLKWPAGTELQFIVRDEHHVELVDSETYYREKFEREAKATPQPATAGA